MWCVVLFLLAPLSLSWSAALPDLQAKLDAGWATAQNPATQLGEALNWDWCDNHIFVDSLDLATPWEQTSRRGVNLSQTPCSELKKTWELYDKRLTPIDLNNRILTKTGQALTKPYFALYNRYTGVMRVFLWIGPDDNAAGIGQVFVVKSKISEDNSSDIEPTHLMDFYSEEDDVPSLSHPGQSIVQEWIIPEPVNNVWIILDINFSYDPADYTLQDGYDKQLFLNISVSIENVSTLGLSGTWSGELTSTSTPSTSMLTIGRNVLTTGSDAALSGMQMLNSSAKLAASLQKQILPGGNLATKLSDKNKDALGNFAAALAGGLGIEVAIIAGGVKLAAGLKRLFSNGPTVSTKYLRGSMEMAGSLTTQSSQTSYSIPYSGALRTEIPLYAYKYPQSHLRKLGLFHLSRWTNNMEPGSCLLEVNPNTPAKLLDESYFGSNDSLLGLASWPANPKQHLVFSFGDPTDPSSSQRSSTMLLQTGKWLDPPKNHIFFASNNLQDYTGQNRITCKDLGYRYSFVADITEFPEQYAIGVSDYLKLNDRVHVYDNSSGRFGHVYNIGASPQGGYGVELGAEAIVGSIFNKHGTVFLRDRSKVAYELHTPELRMQNQVSAPANQPTGSVSWPNPVPLVYLTENDARNTYIRPYLYDTLVADPLQYFPSVEVRSDQCIVGTSSKACSKIGGTSTLTLPPGFYGDVVVRGGTRLILQAGIYVIRTLQMESQSQFDLQASPASTWLAVSQYVTWRAKAMSYDPSKLLVAVYSAKTQILTTPFHGTFLAPAGAIEMGSGNYETYKGRFYARNIEIHQNTRIVRVPFQTNPQVTHEEKPISIALLSALLLP